MNAQESHKARWSVTTFVVLVALLFSVIAFRHLESALILMVVVLAIVFGAHVMLRQTARRKG
jgi:hypothetical protein